MIQVIDMLLVTQVLIATVVFGTAIAALSKGIWW